MVPPSQYEALRQFLEGLPQRYLQTRLPEHIRNHFQLPPISTRIPRSSTCALSASFSNSP